MCTPLDFHYDKAHTAERSQESLWHAFLAAVIGVQDSSPGSPMIDSTYLLLLVESHSRSVEEIFTIFKYPLSLYP